jgi:transcriptional regulator with XRE-family HTH domain
MPSEGRILGPEYYAAGILRKAPIEGVRLRPMRQLTIEQTEYAVGTLVRLVAHRGVTQTQLAQDTKVNQSTISKILNRTLEAPSEEMLAKLFKALGVNLNDILNEPDCLPEKILGYLATPLTALTEPAHKELHQVVKEIRLLAEDQSFGAPPFEVYWPGDYTHPIQHANWQPKQVYLLDRSRASTHDFVILFCGDPSFGVGQENEIATQAGAPSIRLLPATRVSRMITGSFLRAIDITYTGSLSTGISLPRDQVLDALRQIRKLHFRHRALYRGVQKRDVFGDRLRLLIEDRCQTDNAQCAYDLGISLDYLLTLLNEPISVSNPSAKLLARLARLLSTQVGYLVGEAEEADPVWVASMASWRQWIASTTGIDAGLAHLMQEKWSDEYRTVTRARDPSLTSFRSTPQIMKEEDWDARYQQIVRGSRGQQGFQGKLV